MYGISRDANLDFLKEKTLVQACFAEHTLILNLDPSVSIAIFSSIGFALSGEAVAKYVDFREAAAGILSLLNKDVAEVRTTTDMVTLTFDNGSVLHLYDDSQQFESFTIRAGEKLIVV